MDFTYKINNKGTYAIVEMSGNLIDKNQATPLLDEIQELIQKGTNNFVISMENFRYLNSNGLNVLVNILTKSRKNGGDTSICSISDKIKGAADHYKAEYGVYHCGESAYCNQTVSKLKPDNHN